MTYIPLTPWYPSAQRSVEEGQRFLGAAVRLVAEVDTSTKDAYHVYAELAVYQFASGVTPQYLNFYYFVGGTSKKSARLYINNTEGVLGEPYRWDLGSVSAGSTASVSNVYVGVSLSGIGWVYSKPTSATYTVPFSVSAPTSVTSTRNSDTRNNVSISLPADTMRSEIVLRRYTDGTTKTLETTIQAATTASTAYYVDTGTTIGHSYKYGAVGRYKSPLGSAFDIDSTEVYSSTSYNSPAAPTAISGARTAANTVRLTLTNTASTSTGLEVQASTNPADWTDPITQTYAGAGIAQADISGIAGAYYFRARNTRGALVSSWIQTAEPVVTLVAPNPPTLTQPAGALVNSDAETITFAWKHNPLDGSAQTAADVQTSTDGGSTWTTNSVTTAQTLTVSMFPVGTVVTWRARTKGAADDYSAWSATKQFTVAQAPSIVITLYDPNGDDVTGGTLSDMPLTYEVTYTDASGTFAGGSVTVGDYTESFDMPGGEITASEFLPADGTTYTLTVNVSSTSSLTASASATFTTDFVLPQGGTAFVTDADGIETITVSLMEKQAGEADAVSLALYRETDEVRVLIADNLEDGDTITDRYAPLNKDFAYLVVTTSAAGIARAEAYPLNIACGWWLFLADGITARGRWSPEGSLTFSRPQKTRIQYAGRTYPVSYDGVAFGDSRSVTLTLETLAEAHAFQRLMEQGGRCVYKSADGDVFRADVDITFAPTYQVADRYGKVTVKIIRIEGGAL